MGRYPILTIIIVLFAGIGCTVSPKHPDGVFTAFLEMEDTTARYDLWVTLRVNSRETSDSIALFMKIFPPDGETISLDSLTVPISRSIVSPSRDGRLKGCLSFFSYDIKALYRTGVKPDQSGIWKMVINSEPFVVDEVRVSAEIHNDE